MQSMGAEMVRAVEGTEPTHPLALAHLAVSIAAWLPFPGRQKVQQEDLLPHFFSQS
jgi:hypothetical protein